MDHSPQSLLSTAGVLFIFNNLFRIYVAYRFVGIFFDRSGVNKTQRNPGIFVLFSSQLD